MYKERKSMFPLALGLKKNIPRGVGRDGGGLAEGRLLREGRLS